MREIREFNVKMKLAYCMENIRGCKCFLTIFILNVSFVNYRPYFLIYDGLFFGEFDDGVINDHQEQSVFYGANRSESFLRRSMVEERHFSDHVTGVVTSEHLFTSAPFEIDSKCS